MDRTKEIEFYFFNQFCTTFGLNPLLVTQREQPDINYDNRIGIEITNFFIQNGKIQNSEQNQAPKREIFLSRCKEKFENQYGISIEINVGFCNNNPLPSKTKAVVEIENNLIKKIHDLHKKNLRENVPYDLFSDIPQISFLYIHNEIYKDIKWTVTQCYSVQEIKKERLVEIIKDKEKKSTQYTVYPENWLLIVIDNINPAQDQYIPRNFDFCYKSNFFNRILIFEKMYGRVYEIKAF